jgi:hypothetical protein
MLKLTKHTIIYLFSLNQVVIQNKTIFWKEKQVLDTNAYLIILIEYFPQIAKKMIFYN